MKPFIFQILTFLMLFLAHFFNLQAQTYMDELRQNLQLALQDLEQSEFETALSKFDNILTIHAQKGGQFLPEIALAQNGKVATLTALGKEKEAFLLGEQTLAAARANFQLPLLEAQTLNYLGLLRLKEGKNDKANLFFKEALMLVEDKTREIEMLPKTEKIEERIRLYKTKNLTYNNLAILNWYSGNQESAIDFLNNALFYLDSLEKKITDFDKIYATEKAATLNNLGLIYTEIDLVKAQFYYEQALSLYLKSYEADHLKVAQAYNNLGLTYQAEGLYETALTYFEKSLTIRKSKEGENHPNVAFLYRNLANLYDLQYRNKNKREYAKKRQESLNLYQKALAIYLEAYGEKHPEIASTFNQIGQLHLHNEDFQAALTAFQAALISNVFEFNEKAQEKNPEKTAIPYNIELLLNSFALKAQTLVSRYNRQSLSNKDLKDALASLYAADSFLEQARNERNNKKDKLLLGQTAILLYETAIEAALLLAENTLQKQFYYQKALYFAERSKSATLLEAIADANAKQFAGIPAPLLERERNLAAELTFLEQKLASEKEKEAHYRSQILILRQTYQNFIDSLENQYPAYYQLKYQNQSLELAQIQAQLPKETRLLSFFEAEKNGRWYIFSIDKENLEIFDLPKSDDFDKKMIGFRNALFFKNEVLYQDLAYKLYRELIPSALDKDRLSKWVIIPEVNLQTLPFEVLLASKHRQVAENEAQSYDYLFLNKIISYDYSIQLFLNRTQTSDKKTATALQNIYLFAPIEFNFLDKQNQAALQNLPATAQEVEDIAQIFKRNQKEATIFTYQNASENAFKNAEATPIAYLHIATHGVVDAQNPELSKIYFNRADSTSQDGFLFVGEIYNLKLDTELTVLSACQTGLGKKAKGEGLLGFSRALTYAGAKDLVLSFWNVADESTAVLMRNFYHYLIEEQLSASEALQKAKRQMIENQDFKAPYYWAAFVLIGQ
ncbi:CHAT domain-containing tetratricopeptide repeat protein [Hugenholtzia roseola]|uniref:CHAT domain-containing tetratricopeptide repeat protein n=1 Tax=Hugenholtzia roseola TaxID=1002 RepID=UPI000413C8F9|nr:CHAT domain-containing protein [Hugenholtzia roseola]